MTKKISVYVRVRSNCESIHWSVFNNILYQILDKTTKLSYSCYQNVYHKSKTIDIYNTGIREAINELLDGINCTIFAYGQTGSGKTHTMLGTAAEPGIINLTLSDILSTTKNVEISYLEIYNENIIDLINNKRNIKMFNNSINKICLANVTRVKIKDIKEAIKIIDRCENNRKVGQTEYNERSSRSHTIFQVFIESKNATLSLIDLAGSEKATGSLERRKEGAYINKSLLALGTVINKIIKNEYVSYRDSKLTRILQQSLDGNSNVVSLCMISPTSECLSESINTLKFAARLSKVELKDKKERIIITESIESNMCSRCKCEIKDFSAAIEEKECKNIDILEIDIPANNETSELDSMLLKAENQLYKERVRCLEDTILSLLNQSQSRRISDLFVLEKNMFLLQLEIIKRKKK